METNIKSKVLGVVELISEGWKVYFANIKTILPIVLCVYIPIELVVSFIPQDSQSYDWILIALNIVGLIATLSIAVVTENAIEGESIDWNEALMLGLSKWTTAIGTGFLASVRIIGYSLIFILPGIIYSVYYMFVPYVVMLRDIGGKEALEYSKNLVEGQWWRIFGIAFVIGLLETVLSLGISYSVNLISDDWYFSIIPNFIDDVIASFSTVTFTLLFLNNDYGYRYQPPEKIPPLDRL
jgi:uncharacterized membrane protein